MNVEYGLKVENIEDIDLYSVFAKEYNIKHLEIQITDCDRDSVFFKEEFFTKINKIRAEKNLNISYHATLGLNFAEKITRIREATLEITCDLLNLCIETESKWLTIHMGTCGTVNSSKQRNTRLLLHRPPILAGLPCHFGILATFSIRFVSDIINFSHC